MQRLPFAKHSSTGRRITEGSGGLIKAARKYAKHRRHVKASIGGLWWRERRSPGLACLPHSAKLTEEGPKNARGSCRWLRRSGLPAERGGTTSVSGDAAPRGPAHGECSDG